MKIVAIACARDEIDIIEAFVRHTLSWVDRLIVLDNGSTDGTRDVLKGLCQEGLPLEVVDDPSLGKYLSRRVTRLMHEHALTAGAIDWVLPLDVDEFIHVPGGGPLIPEGTEKGRPLQLPWSTYVPSEDDDSKEGNPVIRIRQRLVREESGLTKVIVPAELAAHKGAVITQGSHTLVMDGQAIHGVDAQHACLAHFPIRTPGQFVAKTVIGHLQNEVLTGRNPGWGFHHRDHFEQLRSDPTAFIRKFSMAARRYSVIFPGAAEPETVLDPFPYRSGPLRLTPAVDDSRRAWAPVLNYVKGLAKEHGLLRASLSSEGTLWFENQAEVMGMVLDHLDVLGQACRSSEAALRDRDAQVLQHRQELEALRVQCAAQIALVRNNYERSWSWRVGRSALEPLRLMRRAAQTCRRLVAS